MNTIKVEINLVLIKKMGIIIPEAPNFGHQWYFNLEDYSIYESILLLKCTKCNYEIIYVYNKEKYLTNVATANLFRLNESFKGKIIETCEQALNVKNMQDALE